MLEYFLKFNRDNFYQEKNSHISTAVGDYARLKSQGAGQEELSQARRQAVSCLADSMQECGLAGEESSYISLEKEFFTPEGEFDQARLSRFQSKILRHYAAQQLRWSFAGTSSQFTQITIREMEKNNQVYTNLLPVELQREYRMRETLRKTPPDPGKYRANIYQDGTVTPEILPDKKRLRFDVLRDNSGFAWDKGYSPDNEVSREHWQGGYNCEGEWVKTTPDQEEFFSDSPDSHPIAVFLGSEDPGKVGLLSSLDMTFLFDPEALLMEGEEETVYTLQGDVYARRAVDREKSLENLKKVLEEKKIKKIDKIILREITPEAQDFYRKILAPYVHEETAFFKRTDEKLQQELQELREETTAREVSDKIVSGFLSAGQLKEETLYKKLLPTDQEPAYSLPLNIFESEEQMLTFLSLPEIADNLEEEAVDLLKTMHIPEDKKESSSNAIQNILHSYRELFAHSALPQSEILRAVRDLQSEDSCNDVVRNETLTTEQSLHEFILSALHPGVKTAIPSFRQFKKPRKYDFSDPRQRELWMETEVKSVLPADTVDIVHEVLSGDTFKDLDANFIYPAVGKILSEYKAITSSTGMPPGEILQAIETVIHNKPGVKDLKRKRVFFEAPLENVLREAAQSNPHRVVVHKEGDYNRSALQLEWKPFSATPDLLEPSGLDSFVNSPLCKESGFMQEEVNQIAGYLQSVGLPPEKHVLFSAAALRIIRGYKYRIKPSGTGIIPALQGLASLVDHTSSQLEPRVLKVIAQVAGLPALEDGVVFAAATPAALKLDTFLELPLVRESGISREESAVLHAYLRQEASTSLAGSLSEQDAADKDSVLQAKLKQEAATSLAGKSAEEKAITKDPARTLAQVLQRYPDVIQPAGFSPRDVLKALLNPASELSPELARVLETLQTFDPGSFKGRQREREHVPVVPQEAGPDTSAVDLETFLASPFLKEQSLDETEVKAVSSYMKRARVPSHQEGFFRKAVLQAIRRLPQAYPAGEVTVMDAVKAVASSIRGKSKKLPERLQSFISGVLAAASGRGGGRQWEDSVNLLKKDGKEAFLSSPLFRESALSSGQLETLIQAHRRAYSGAERKYYTNIDVSYLEKAPLSSADEKVPAMELAGTPSPSPREGEFNLGWIRRQQADRSFIRFTPSASAFLAPGSRRRILQWLLDSGASFRPKKSGADTPVPAPLTTPSGMDDKQAELDLWNLLASSIRFPGQNYTSLAGEDSARVFSQQAAYINRRRSVPSTGMSHRFSPSYKGRQPSTQPGMQKHSPPPRQGPKQTPEEKRFQRIEENYRHDKEMLARSKSGSPPTGSTSQKGAVKDDGTIIQRFSEDVINEIKNEIDSEL